ncbi:MAG: PLP-dependent aminotransferase family protein [candidate division WOR-3 bacterium]|nr:PLP-dependent aminotransferase family protein [candidate division WOR-3 bacterium]
MEKKYEDMWLSSLSKRSKRLQSSVIRELLKVTQYPEVVSFAGGLPAPEFFPKREIEEACRHLIPRNGEKMLQYGATEGVPELKEFLSEKMRKYGVPSEPENILLTSGSQQALDLIGKVFINEGDRVLVSEPTYLGALQAWWLYGPEFVTCGMDEDGVIISEVEDVLKEGPVKFMYMLPNFHNPAGVTISLERRKRLVQLAEKYNTFIVEDDPYGELRYEGEDITPIIVLKKERVIYLSTFSKTLCPGFRLGWIVAPKLTLKKIIQAKQGADLHTGTFVQYIVNDLCQRGILKAHVAKLKKVYKERRDVMLESLEKYFPKEARWTYPKGGLFLWVTLPEGTDTEVLFEKGKKNNVAFVPGLAFYPNEKGRNTMRLNFSNTPPDRIREGIKRLGEMLKEEL